MRVSTSSFSRAGIGANVSIKIHGDFGVTQQIFLDNPGLDDFQPGKYVE